MRKSRFTEAQIIGMIKEQEAGMPTAEVCRKHGLSQGTFYRYKSQYGSMEVSDVAKLRAMEDENAKLKGDIARPSASATCIAKQDEQVQNELKRLQEEVADLKAKAPGGARCQEVSSAPLSDKSHDRLQDDLDRAEKEKQSLADKLRTTSLAEQRLQSRIVNLESEKAMLQNELKAFDLDFFEEIEDLKFKYSEVCKQLKKHTVSSGGTSKEGGDDIEEDNGGLGPWSSLIY